MAVSARYILAALAVTLAPASALANPCCTGGVGTSPPPSIDPTPPPAPAPQPRPPSGGGCNSGSGCGLTGPVVTVPSIVPTAPIMNGPIFAPGGVNVVVNNRVTTSVVTNVGGNSTTIIGGGNGGGGGGGTLILRSGGGSVPVGMPIDPGVLGPVVAERSIEGVEVSTREFIDMAPIRATCMDDKGNPHPASQTFAAQVVEANFGGEIFRCMAGTRMDITVGRMVDNKPVFDGGRTFGCAKGEALVVRGDEVVCVTQVARRQCNERSLLRRHGPGIKFVRTRTQEEIRKPVTRQVVQKLGDGMALDGGVGQGLY